MCRQSQLLIKIAGDLRKEFPVLSVLTRFFAIRLLGLLALVVLSCFTTSFAQSITNQLPLGRGYYASNQDQRSYWWPQIAVNPLTNRVYVLRYVEENGPDPTVFEVNGNDNSFQMLRVDFTFDSQPSRPFGIAINPQTNRLYMPAARNILVFDLNTGISLSFPHPILSPLVNVAVNPNTNRIYMVDVDLGNIVVMNGGDNSMEVVPSLTSSRSAYWGVAANPTTNRVYLTGAGAADCEGVWAVDVMDPDNHFSRVCVPPYLYLGGPIAVNPATNRIYMSALDLSDPGILKPGILVMNGADNSLMFVDAPNNPDTSSWGDFINFSSIAVNAATNRVYLSYKTAAPFRDMNFLTLDGNTNAAQTKVFPGGQADGDLLAWGIGVNTATNRLYIPIENTLLTVAPDSSGLITGTEPVQADAARLTFSDVTSPGTVSVVPISDPATAGEVPGGFAISDLFAYEITKDTSLQFSGSVTTCFNTPAVNDQTEFNSLAVLHRELNQATGQYELFDRTSSRTFSTRTICATTTSFSPFYLARKSDKIRSLFDKSRAYKSGSTVPVKLQLLNANNQNISSAATILAARGLRLVGGNTTSSVIDSGNANADGNFRFDSSLQGYIFNLSTKGLASGQYVLSFYAGSDRAFFYTAKFEVK